MSLLSALALALATTAIAGGGNFDRSFSGDGRQTTRIAAAVTGDDVALDPKGRIVAVGSASPSLEFGKAENTEFAVARFKPNGALDRSFSGDGRLRLKRSDRDRAEAVAVQKDGRILVAGSSSSVLTVLRFTERGRLDRSFSGDGVLSTGGRFSGAYAVAVSSDGKIVVAGSIISGSNRDIVVLRLTRSGRRDRSFSGNGKSLVDFSPGSNDEARALLVRRDGRVIVAGSSCPDPPPNCAPDLALARLTHRGGLDPSFAGDGLATTDLGGRPGETIHGITLDRRGRLIAAGTVQDFQRPALVAARYLPGGQLDGSFGGDGTVTVSGGPGHAIAFDAALQRNGRILLGGQISESLDARATFVRLKPDGNLDSSFGTNGRLDVRFGGKPGAIEGLTRQKDGKIVAAGALGGGEAEGGGLGSLAVFRLLGR